MKGKRLMYLLVLFSQVNSDKIYWQRNLDATFSQIHSEKKAVGHCISTKAVGSDERADITHLYKHQEGTGKLQLQIDVPEADRIISALPGTILKCNDLILSCCIDHFTAHRFPSSDPSSVHLLLTLLKYDVCLVSRISRICQ